MRTRGKGAWQAESSTVISGWRRAEFSSASSQGMNVILLTQSTNPLEIACLVPEDLFACSPVLVWVSSRYSGFSQDQTMYLRLILQSVEQCMTCEQIKILPPSSCLSKCETEPLNA